MNSRRILTIALAGMLTVFALAGCGEKNLKAAISKKLSVDCSSAGIVEQYDSHGGFLGDGTSFYAMKCPDGSVREQIAGSGEWRAFPLSDCMKVILWGQRDEEHDFAPLIIRDNDWDHPLVPEVENGYWFFRDRHSDATDPKDESQALDDSRPSYNFTVAVYDADTDTLYFAELDT